MKWDLDQRRASFSAGEFADFSLGPRTSDGGPRGLWRAQLGTYWHQQLRIQNATTAGARFEVPLNGEIFHRGWVIGFTGRIDQLIPSPDGVLLREVKTVTRPLPAPEAELREAYPGYFLQLGVYAALLREGRLEVAPETPSPDLALSELPPAVGRYTPELYFIEVGSGLAQAVAYQPEDEARFHAQLERITEFLDMRIRSRERLRRLVVHAPFSVPRPGQEHTLHHLQGGLVDHTVTCFEAPTGFGKTGLLLQASLDWLHHGKAERLIYLTSKTTGQLQVRHTLERMTSHDGGLSENTLASWVVRPKSEHCVNSEFRCSTETCRFLKDLEKRWPGSGLSRIYLMPDHARDLPTLRSAGQAAAICPYEITRAALPFNEVWIGDFNYVFAPSARGVFLEQPGFDPANTVLVVDEAHNLPSRVADAFSHAFTARAAADVVRELQRIRSSNTLVRAFDNWAFFLGSLHPSEKLAPADEEDAIEIARAAARALQESAFDHSAISTQILETLWQLPYFVAGFDDARYPRLWWSPRQGELQVTCLDAASEIGPTLRSFQRVLLASATFGPLTEFERACGIHREDTEVAPGAYGSAGITTSDKEDNAPRPAPDRLGALTKRDTRKIFRNLRSGAELLQATESRDALAVHPVSAEAPWRNTAYDVVIDTRVDTRYAQRAAGYPLTAASLLAMRAHAPAEQRCVAAFFPSYAYAEAVHKQVLEHNPGIRIALQPRAAQMGDASAWIDQNLEVQDFIFLVLGSSLAESIDHLGGRIHFALVAGPALPEVNAVQKAKTALYGEARGQRDHTFRRVYQVPGMQRVNQALGRLVRAPGQTCRIVLHCRRFEEESYRRLLASEYQHAVTITTDQAFSDWLAAHQ